MPRAERLTKQVAFQRFRAFMDQNKALSRKEAVAAAIANDERLAEHGQDFLDEEDDDDTPPGRAASGAGPEPPRDRTRGLY